MKRVYRLKKTRRIKDGRLFAVTNKDRKTGSANVYVCVFLENASGKSEPYLFTDSQLEVARTRAAKNPEDCLKRKRFWFF